VPMKIHDFFGRCYFLLWYI